MVTNIDALVRAAEVRCNGKTMLRPNSNAMTLDSDRAFFTTKNIVFYRSPDIFSYIHKLEVSFNVFSVELLRRDCAETLLDDFNFLQENSWPV